LPCAAFGGRREINGVFGAFRKGLPGGDPLGEPLGSFSWSSTLEELEKAALLTKSLQERDRPIFESDPRADCAYELPLLLQRQGSIFNLFFGIRGAKNEAMWFALIKRLFKDFFLHLLDEGSISHRLTTKSPLCRPLIQRSIFYAPRRSFVENLSQYSHTAAF